MEPIAHQADFYTPQEHDALEKKSAVRHEYINGRRVVMRYDTLTHNILTQNMMVGLRLVARARGCRVFTSSVRLVVQENAYYTYPDVMLACDPADHRDAYAVRHPVLIAEVLSPGTADYDRTEKFANYQKLPSLRHYLLVSQTAWVVEWFRRDEAGQWIYTLLHEPTSVLTIPDLGLVLPLRELYEDTDVAPLRVHPGPDPLPPGVE